MAGNPNRQLTLLLILATLGACLIIYRLGSTANKVANRRPRHTLPIDDDAGGGNGPLAWKRRIVAVGDLHGGECLLMILNVAFEC